MVEPRKLFALRLCALCGRQLRYDEHLGGIRAGKAIRSISSCTGTWFVKTDPHQSPRLMAVDTSVTDGWKETITTYR